MTVYLNFNMSVLTSYLIIMIYKSIYFSSVADIGFQKGSTEQILINLFPLWLSSMKLWFWAINNESNQTER